MKEDVEGKYGKAIIFTDNIEKEAIKQVKTICDMPYSKNCDIRIMPDVHAGIGCVIGFTGNLNQIVPSLVGVDSNCGVLDVPLGKVDLDLKALDQIVNDKIPSGFNVHEEPLVNYKIFGRLMDKFGLSEDKQFHINCSIGTLGGGNHFIEVDENDDGFKHLLIHSGSRNLGQQIFRYYNNIAKDNDTRSAVTKLIYELKEEGCQKEIQEQIKNLKCTKYPKDLIPLPIEYTSDYLNDMTTVRRYARINREVMAMQILNEIPEINTSDALCLSTETLHLKA